MFNNLLANVFPVVYHRYLKSARWRKKAAAARKRAGYRCQLCNQKAPLQAHHRTYERLGYELPGDLIALCASCHRRYHGRLKNG